MPSDFIGELILKPILEAIFEVGAYYVGRPIVSIISFGRWKCDPLLRGTPRKKLRWGGFLHRRGQQLYLTAEATALIGILFSALVIASIAWWHFRD